MEIIVPIILALCISSVSPTPRGRKSKGLISTLLDGQRQTERRNRPRSPMCGPGGSKRRR